MGEIIARNMLRWLKLLIKLLLLHLVGCLYYYYRPDTLSYCHKMRDLYDVSINARWRNRQSPLCERKASWKRRLFAWLNPYSPPKSSGLNIYHDVCIHGTRSNEMKASIQIEGEVNDKVDNLVCVRRPECVALQRDNGSPHCHTKDNFKQLLWELNYTWGFRENQISPNRLAWSSLIQRSQVVSNLASRRFRVIAEVGRDTDHNGSVEPL